MAKKMTARQMLVACARLSMKVIDGGEAVIDERREHILDKISRELETAEAYRQNYSNGEFISNSLIVGRTFEAVSGRELELDGAARVAFHDVKRNWWWRQGGCWD